MCQKFARLIPIILLFWTAGGMGTAWANYLIVQARTDCKPMEDFHTAVVTVRDRSGRFVKRVNTPASPSRDWSRGVRIAELELNEGTYRAKVGLRHRSRGMIAERPVRVAVDRRVRVVTILLTCPEPEPRTGHGSAPGDPPPLPQLKRPLPQRSPGLPPGTRPQLNSRLTGKVCYNSVQDRLAWNYSGNTRWSQANIDRLCKGAESSTEPARCFQKIMHGNVSHGTNTRWRWQDALELCAGTRNHRSRVDCFQRQIRKGAGQRAAISRCKNA